MLPARNDYYYHHHHYTNRKALNRYGFFSSAMLLQKYHVTEKKKVVRAIFQVQFQIRLGKSVLFFFSNAEVVFLLL